jgi:hypothetical protein
MDFGNAHNATNFRAPAVVVQLSTFSWRRQLTQAVFLRMRASVKEITALIFSLSNLFDAVQK